jgi:hypothetical protein
MFRDKLQFLMIVEKWLWWRNNGFLYRRICNFFISETFAHPMGAISAGLFSGQKIFMIY